MQENNSTLREILAKVKIAAEVKIDAKAKIAPEVQESDMQELMDMWESVAMCGMEISLLSIMIVLKIKSNTLPLELKPVYEQLIRAFGDTMQPMQDFINKTEQYVKNQRQ